MNLNITCCLFVLENIPSENKRKSDKKNIKVLVDNNNNLVNIDFNEEKDAKTALRDEVASIIGTNIFHLEQVYTFANAKYYEHSGVTITHLGITNEENITNLKEGYRLIDFDVIDKKTIVFGDKRYEYQTVLKESNNNIEYLHNINCDDLGVEKQLKQALTCYKQIISKIDYTDIMFKFLPQRFSLEEVRIIYEKIKQTSVDKSNFRKKIMKYCTPTDVVDANKGHRPSRLFSFKPYTNDVWV